MELLPPTPIPLKLKYRVPHKSRYRAGYMGNNSKAKLHRKLTEREIALHAAQPEKVMVMTSSGKVRMVIVS